MNCLCTQAQHVIYLTLTCINKLIYRLHILDLPFNVLGIYINKVSHMTTSFLRILYQARSPTKQKKGGNKKEQEKLNREIVWKRWVIKCGHMEKWENMFNYWNRVSLSEGYESQFPTFQRLSWRTQLLVSQWYPPSWKSPYGNTLTSACNNPDKSYVNHVFCTSERLHFCLYL